MWVNLYTNLTTVYNFPLSRYACTLSSVHSCSVSCIPFFSHAFLYTRCRPVPCIVLQFLSCHAFLSLVLHSSPLSYLVVLLHVFISLITKLWSLSCIPVNVSCILSSITFPVMQLHALTFL